MLPIPPVVAGVHVVRLNRAVLGATLYEKRTFVTLAFVEESARLEAR